MYYPVWNNCQSTDLIHITLHFILTDCRVNSAVYSDYIHSVKRGLRRIWHLAFLKEGDGYSFRLPLLCVCFTLLHHPVPHLRHSLLSVSQSLSLNSQPVQSLWRGFLQYVKVRHRLCRWGKSSETSFEAVQGQNTRGEPVEVNGNLRAAFLPKSPRFTVCQLLFGNLIDC